MQGKFSVKERRWTDRDMPYVEANIVCKTHHRTCSSLLVPTSGRRCACLVAASGSQQVVQVDCEAIFFSLAGVSFGPTGATDGPPSRLQPLTAEVG